MLNLPQTSGDTVVGLISDYFSPYSNPKVGDYLMYNANQDKMVIMDINDKPEYAVKNIERRYVFKYKSTVEIVKL